VPRDKTIPPRATTRLEVLYTLRRAPSLPEGDARRYGHAGPRLTEQPMVQTAVGLGEPYLARNHMVRTLRNSFANSTQVAEY
jgi:hypothetical protein